MEFTPYECGIAQDVNLYVPTFAFGRKFNQGLSTDFAVEPSLALLQATWGSAFCATVSLQRRFLR
jgi:phospholipase A2